MADPTLPPVEVCGAQVIIADVGGETSRFPLPHQPARGAPGPGVQVPGNGTPSGPARHQAAARDAARGLRLGTETTNACSTPSPRRPAPRSVVLPSASITRPGNPGRRPVTGGAAHHGQGTGLRGGRTADPARGRSAVSEPTPLGARRHGAMRLRSPAQRRQWQDETLHSPRLRYGIPAWLLFRLEDVVFGPGRSVPKFRALEIINRVALPSLEQAAYYLAGKLRERSSPSTRCSG